MTAVAVTSTDEMVETRSQVSAYFLAGRNSQPARSSVIRTSSGVQTPTPMCAPDA